MAKKKRKANIIKKEPNKATLTNNKNWIWGLAIALLGFLIYANTLGHDFALDDFSAIKDNYVTKQGVAGIPTIWQEHYRFGYWNSVGELYRPLPLTMFAVEWGIAPDTPAIHHFVNVFLYALTGLLLFLVLSKILDQKDQVLALLATILFIAHPVHTEIVANIKSRDEILAFFFFLTTLQSIWAYIYKQTSYYYLILGSFTYGLALFSKESAITFLALFPLIIYFFSPTTWKQISIVMAALLIPAVVFLLVRSQVLSGFVTGGKVNSVLDNLLVTIDQPMDRIATTILLLGKYLWIMVFPHPLGSDFGYNQIPATSFGDWRVLLSLFVHLGMIGIAIWGFKKKHILSFCALFYGISFSIFSNVVVEIGSSFGERFLYIPLLGFTMVVAYALQQLFPAKGQGFLTANKWALMIGGALVVLYSIKTIDRNRAWKNSFTLYATDIQTAPNSAKLNYHYGLEASKKGQSESNVTSKQQYFKTAKLAFNKAIAIYPTYGDAYGQLGLTLYREGKEQEALHNYEQSVKYKTNNALVYSNMGIIYFQKKQLDKAKEVYSKAVSIDPRFVDARRNLGVVYAMQSNFPAAIEQFKEALKYAPNDATINHYLGSAYRDSGNESAGRPYLEKAYQLNPQLRK